MEGLAWEGAYRPLTLREASEHFMIPQSTIADIWKNRVAICATDPKHRRVRGKRTPKTIPAAGTDNSSVATQHEAASALGTYVEQSLGNGQGSLVIPAVAAPKPTLASVSSVQQSSRSDNNLPVNQGILQHATVQMPPGHLLPPSDCDVANNCKRST